jgi:hypothetical protein
MGIICTMKDLERIWSLNNHYPIISTIKTETTINRFRGYSYLSLGEQLSSSLLKHKKHDRKNYVTKELEKILLSSDSKKIIIDNIDMLFNPEYNLNILGLFIQLARNRNLIIIWPGKYDSGNLTYAFKEYVDYRRYLVKNYDIICLV